jgi:hypothetical protein
MNFLFIILHSLVFINCSEITYSISGSIKNCEKKEWLYGAKPFMLYNEDKSINRKIDLEVDSYFNCDNLPKGTYYIEYENFFEQIIKKKIEIIDRDKNIQICFDEFADTKIPTLISNLKANDKLTISFSSNGCFHNLKERVIFSRKNKEIFGEYISGKKKKVVKINTKKFNYLVLFEKKVKQIQKVAGMCTTSDSYTFILNGKEKFKAEDGGCEWDGFELMVNKVFKQ